ncbi:MAG: NUDIX domain-containing protein [Candidatus Woesearchaeota archaeon]
MTEVAKVIVYNSKNECLLQLREDNPNIEFPLHWNLLGRVVEESDTPINAARRELLKALGVYIENPKLFRVQNNDGIKQHIFAVKLDMKPSEFHLGEGIEVKWFTEAEINTAKIAFNYRGVLKEFLGGK